MISKSSFWVSIKENNKRRIWVWILSVLAYIIAFPTMIAILISRVKTNESYLVETFGETLGSEILHNDIVGRMKECFGTSNFVLLLVAAGFAVVSAIQGFCYLYNKQKIDFYMGMPVKRSRRFLVIWLNGILIYLIPSLAGTLLGWLVVAGNGAMTAEVVKESILATGLLFCFYLGIYHLAILAVMMTGNVIITCMGTAVFFLYEWAVRNLLTGYMALFFRHFGYQEDSGNQPWLSPFFIYGRFADKHMDGEGNGLMTAFYLLLFAAVIMIIAYICYLKRPAEAAGKAMAFKPPMPVIKILIVIPATLLSGYVVSDAVGYAPVYGEGSPGFVFFTMAIVLVVVSCLIQVLYEFDIRGIFHKKRHILISAVAVAGIFLIFRYDLLGYDSYLPKVEKVSSVAVITPYEYSYYGDNYFDEDMEYISKSDYVRDNMYLTDTGAVNKLLKKSIDLTKRYEDLNQIYTEENSDIYRMGLIYRMGNKRTVSRQIFVDINDPETAELIDRIESSQEYIDSMYVDTAEKLEKMLARDDIRTRIVYGSSIYYNKLTQEETKELLSLYKEDVKKSSFLKNRENVPTGSLRIDVEKKTERYTSYKEAELKIYPFYDKCVAYLTERGYYMEGFFNPEDVEKIQITNYNSAIQEAEREAALALDPAYDSAAEAMLALGRKEQYYGTEESPYIRSAVYEDKAEIEEICKELYPSDWISSGFSMDTEIEPDYNVIVYFKLGTSGRTDDGAGTESVSCVFPQGRVPGYVAEDTAYKK